MIGTITRLRAPLIADAYSTTPKRRDWDHAAPTELTGFAIDPGQTAEVATANRTQITTTPTLYGPYGADILPSDRIRTSVGVEWEVAGRRLDWQNPFSGEPAGSTWPLKRVEG